MSLKIREPDGFRIVGIGASAGGLEALERFFMAISEPTDMAYVVVQHLSPDFKSLMHELIGRFTSMAVYVAGDDMEVKPNSIYVIPSNKGLLIEGGRLKLVNLDENERPHFAIDRFFESLAIDQKEKSIAVVLSGTGTDGSRALEKIIAQGGQVFVQNPETSAFDGMPNSAIKRVKTTGVGDAFDLPRLIHEEIHPELKSDFFEVQKPVEAIFDILEERCGINFKQYKPATIERRIQRRIELTKQISLEAYLEFLEVDEHEPNELYKDLLIGVTRFFRDQFSFDKLRDLVLPGIFKSTPPTEEIRIWVCGCATGEEAYSVAILVREVAIQLQATHAIRIFATDAHKGSLKIASLGKYSLEKVSNISEEMLKKYFVFENDYYVVAPPIRQMVVFSQQNVVKDPPFTHISLVCCRNLLIYLKDEAQRRALGMFHFSLRKNSYLFLGSSETLGSLKDDYATIDRTARLFQKLKDAAPPSRLGVPKKPVISVRDTRPTSSPALPYLNRELLGAYDSILEKYIHPSLLMNNKRELLHVFGDAGRYFKRMQGRPTSDVMMMIKGDVLKAAIMSATKTAIEEKRAVIVRGVEAVASNDTLDLIDLTVDPLIKKAESSIDIFLIIFERIGEALGNNPLEVGSFDPKDVTRERILELEQELAYAREHLHTTVEELETSNEELQATNEEMLASNEELQSTNEELHSTNEELYTVNSEFERKNNELIELHNDIDNLLKSTEIGTVFVDGDLRIRKFTPAISRNFNLLTSDIGRPFDHLTFNVLLDSKDLAAKTKIVIETGEPYQREAQDRNSHWHLVRIFPFVRSEGDTFGAVITLVDINMIKEAERHLKRHADQLKVAKDDLEGFAYAVSHKLQTPLRAVSGYIELLGESLDDAELLNDYLSCCNKSALDLREQINALLAYTRVESRGRAFKELPLEALVSKAIESKQHALDKVSANVEIELNTAMIAVDEDQFIMLLGHLIDNSIKFRSERPLSILITSSMTGDLTDIVVRDNGIGVENVIQNEIFELFFKGYTDDEYGGLGIGLAVCKRIAIRHSGRIWVDSSVDHGTSVTISIPQKQRELSKTVK